MNFDYRSRAQQMIYEAEATDNAHGTRNWFQEHPVGGVDPSVPTAWKATIGLPLGYMVQGAAPSDEYRWGVSKYKAIFIQRVDQGQPPSYAVSRCEIWVNGVRTDTLRLSAGQFTGTNYRSDTIAFSVPASISSSPSIHGGLSGGYGYTSSHGTGSLGNGAMIANDASQGNVDLRVWWFGQVSTYLDKVIVEDSVAHVVMNGAYDAATQAEAVTYAGCPTHDKFYLSDEPWVSSFRGFRYISDQIKTALPNNPKAGSLTATFHDYERFITETNPDRLIFDWYALKTFIPSPSLPYRDPASTYGIATWDTVVYLNKLQLTTDTLLENLRPIANAAQLHAKPWLITPQLHGFLYASTHKYANPAGTWTYRPPTAAELRMHVNLGLCYGATGIIPFPYGTLYATDDNFSNAPMAMPGLVSNRLVGGLRSDHSKNVDTVFGQNIWTGYKEKWDELKAINTRLKTFGDTLLALTWLGAKSWSSGLTAGTWGGIVTSAAMADTLGVTLLGSTYVETGHFQRGGTTDYIYVMNRRTDSSPATLDRRDITITLNRPWPKILVTDIEHGSQWDVANGGCFTDRFNPGEGKMYRITSSHLGSISSTVMAPSSQRKMVRDYFGNYWMTYESGGNIWVTRSTDGGSTWLDEQLVNLPDPTWTAHNPSAAVMTGSTPLVGIVYEYWMNDNSGYYLCFRSVNPSNGVLNWEEFIDYGSPLGTTPRLPVVSGDMTGWFFAAWYDADDHAMKGALRDGDGYWHVRTLRSGSISGVTTPPAIGAGIGFWQLLWIEGGNLHYAPIVVNQPPVLISTPDSIVAYGGDDNIISNPSAVGLPRTTGCPAVAWRVTMLTSPPRGHIRYREHSDQSGWSPVRIWNVTGSNFTTPTTGGSTDFDDVSVLWLSGTNQIQCAQRKRGVWYAAANLASGIDPEASADAHSNGLERVAYRSVTGPFYPINQSGLSYGGGSQQTAMMAGTTAAAQDQARGGTYILTNGAVVRLSASTPMLDGVGVNFIALPDTFAVRTAADFAAGLKTDPVSVKGTLSTSLTYRAKGNVSSGAGFDVVLQNVANGRTIATLASLRGVADTAFSLSASVSGSAQQQVRLALIPVTPSTVAARQVERYMPVTATQLVVDGTPEEAIIPIQQLAKAEALNDVPTEYGLKGGFPNPFNPSTVIRYQLPEDGRVSFMVYDVLGRKVALLADGVIKAGYHSATWNAQNVATGVYFARLVVTDALGKQVYAKTAKLLLMK